MYMPPPQQQQHAKNQAVGPLVFVDKDTFLALVDKDKSALVVYAGPWLLNKNYHYMCSVKGITFILHSKEKIPLPSHADAIAVDIIHIPFWPVSKTSQIFALSVLGVIICGFFALIIAVIIAALRRG